MFEWWAWSRIPEGGVADGASWKRYTSQKHVASITKTRRKVSRSFFRLSSNGRQRHLSAPSVNNGCGASIRPARGSEPMQIQRTRSIALEIGCNPIQGSYRSRTSHLIIKVPWIIDNFSVSRLIRSVSSNLKTFHRFQHWRALVNHSNRSALIGSPGRLFSIFKFFKN
jgi:hypothetical protein